MATILDGKALAAKCKEAVKAEAQSLARKPGLAVIIVGNNPASRVYVNSKRKDCEECGFLSKEYALPEETTQAELIALIEELNGRDDIDGILCQLPLPQGIDEEAVLLAISPEKDVDGFHPMSMGSLLIGREGFLPCTPYGIMEILDEYHIDPKGKHCVVIGRSNIVGKPMALPDPEPGRGLPQRRHPGRRSGEGKPGDRRHGEARRCGHRRGYEPQRGGKTLRRRGLSRGERGGLRHYPRPRRRWPHDPRHADEKHPPGRPKAPEIRR